MAISPSIGSDQGDSDFEGPPFLDILLVICAIVVALAVGSLASNTELAGRWRLLCAFVAAAVMSLVVWVFASWHRAYSRAQRRLATRITEWEQWHAGSKAAAGSNAAGSSSSPPATDLPSSGLPSGQTVAQPPDLPGMPPGPDAAPPGLPGMPPGPTPGFTPPTMPQHQGLNAFANWTHGTAPKSGPFSMPAYPPKPPPGVPPLPGWTDSSELGAKPDALEQSQLNAALAASEQPSQAEVTRVAAAAKHVRELLAFHHQGASTNPSWGQHFWGAVVALHAQALLPAAILAALQSYGYVGVGTLTAPRAEALTQALLRLETAAVPKAPPAGAASASMTPPTALSDDMSRWSHALPTDTKRAAAEIYRSMRNQGTHSVREWLSQSFVGDKTKGQWADLWSMACQLDFLVGDCKSEEALYHLLGTSDTCEVILRHLSAYIYSARTGDSLGAAKMRAVAAPGTLADVAPSWLVSEITQESKVEYQRDERVRAARQRKGKGKGKKGKDKGKDDEA